MESPWVKDVAVCAKELNVNLTTGLSDAEVESRRAKHGMNELAEEEPRSFFQMVMEQFDDPLVKVLLAAAVVSTILAINELYELNPPMTSSSSSSSHLSVFSIISFEHFVEPLVIIAILILNAVVGVWQESNAEKSLEALKEMQPDVCTVLRNNILFPNLPAKYLVPGDIVSLSTGNKVPADCRVFSLKTTTLRVEQMALTGESLTVSKTTNTLNSNLANCEIQSKHNMLFSGTTISSGSCLSLVTSTGMSTEIGKIQEQIQEAAEAKQEERTPLKQKLDEFSDLLQYLIGFVCLLVWLINVNMFFDFSTFSFDFKKALYYFNIAVALAVAAIPEGLPTVITLCLSLGTRKMAQRNAIVRKLPAVETLGCTTVICSDKTGTLTTNQMSVKTLSVISSTSSIESYAFSGSSYDPNDGEFLLSNSEVVSNSKRATLVGQNLALQQMAKIASLCNEADIRLNTKTQLFEHFGNPTEAALKVMVEKILKNNSRIVDNTAKKTGLSETVDLPANKKIEADYNKVAILEFSRDRKSMSVLTHSTESLNNKKVPKGNELLVKGAPEQILSRCNKVLISSGQVVNLDSKLRNAILSDIEKSGKKAYRVLGFAFKQELGILNIYSKDKENANDKKCVELLSDVNRFIELESDMIFVGTVSMQDPPRTEVKSSIANCLLAGIKLIVMTGDNKVTAESICKEISVFESGENLAEKSFLASDFMRLSEKAQSEILKKEGNLLFSRCEPKFKQDIVKVLKNFGEVVAMTGDGVNDAPALRLADIGIAMGISGTQVAREASDIILADDNFATIVSAIEEGRAIYNNMKAFIRYMISSNLGEVASIFLTSALGLPEAFGSVQLLWVNFVTDGPPATALGFNPSEPDLMTHKPRGKDEVLISHWLMFRYLIIGTYVGLATVGIFIYSFTHTHFMSLELTSNNNSIITFSQLTHFHNCDPKTGEFYISETESISNFNCSMFDDTDSQKQTASTLSLSVLVTIEMLNALNALSEDQSLMTVKPWVNKWLLLAMTISFSLHFMILYVPKFSRMFKVSPLSFNEWVLVFAFSAPVILIDEILKFVGRNWNEAARRQKEYMNKEKKVQ